MTASQQIDQQIANYPDWRGSVMQHLRDLIHRADPEIVEEWKWDTAVYTHAGMVCAVSGFKNHVKINFFKGAQLDDTWGLINNGLDSKSHRSIDFVEADTVNEAGVIDLVKQAVSLQVNRK